MSSSHADGTHLSTSLKDLQSLHVDTIQLSAHSMMINAGGSLGSLSTADLPHIVGHDAGVGGASFDPDVTLTVDPGTLPDSTDISGIAHGLAAAGIDHIGVGGDGNLSLSFAQATAATDAGLNFAQDAHITVNLEASQIGTLTGEPGIGDMGIDHLHVQGGVAEITDAEASTLVDAGVDFVGSDSITLHADQTHLSTSLKGLQDLHVDSIKVDAGVTQLHVDAGDLSGLTASSLPQFDVAQTDASLDVTLRLDASQLDKLDDLAAALRAAGIDHFAVDQPIGDYDAATQAHMATITQESGINFVYEPEPAHTMHTELFSATMEPQDGAGDDHALLQQLLSTFESHEDHGTGGQVVLEDGSINALAEAGMLRAYTADEVVLDGTHSGETLLTTLKQIADFGIDHIIATPSGGPLLVDAAACPAPTASRSRTCSTRSMPMCRPRAASSTASIMSRWWSTRIWRMPFPRSTADSRS
ncbi:MAG: hypothetical protein WDN44_05230 [Sphingomonas sp.]